MSPDFLTLADGLTRLTLAPACGGSIANWQLLAGGQPLLRHANEQALASGLPRQLGCYPLAPWSNRIADGGMALPSGWLALAANTDHDPYPLHGSAWQQPWQVIKHAPRRAHLRLESDQPFAYRAEQVFTLQGGCLNIRLDVIHRASFSAWHGLGLHPYFPRTPATRLLAAAKEVWVGEPGRLPHRQVELPAAWDFRQLSTLPETTVDHGFSGWNGHCRILQPDLGYALDCAASGADHYLLYCPAAAPFFCLEPVSHPINAHHLPGRPGLRLLEPGESLRLEWQLRCSPLDEGH
ncbi:MAG: aldose 1-epimerase [Pseudomonas sp.]|uniref:aldose 1-epimerase n=1 Tax=Pseudomonas sp. TaxID=306 RepID=UPI0033990BD9